MALWPAHPPTHPLAPSPGQEQIISWDAERLKLEHWGEPFYDTDKVTGTMQRFKVTFLREALGHQMSKFHSNLSVMQRNLSDANVQLQDVNRRLRARRRELLPLEQGIHTRTLEIRRERFREGKLRDQLAAARIQGLVSFRAWFVLRPRLANLCSLPQRPTMMPPSVP
jgi:hypothetical protein